MISVPDRCSYIFYHVEARFDRKTSQIKDLLVLDTTRAIEVRAKQTTTIEDITNETEIVTRVARKEYKHQTHTHARICRFQCTNLNIMHISNLAILHILIVFVVFLKV